ncbi:hypothetical protein L596_024773 [Steinernema carpocapsae]|uniref:Uncharacterized protein n=1 Tax=Steinernema carpocapsae TaxID=34508 RepID=A0A4U5M5Q7_STECR|nr:hypothetical protein L596_024773 [Steinernema carpocapsae]
MRDSDSDGDSETRVAVDCRPATPFVLRELSPNISKPLWKVRRQPRRFFGSLRVSKSILTGLDCFVASVILSYVFEAFEVGVLHNFAPIHIIFSTKFCAFANSNDSIKRWDN